MTFMKQASKQAGRQASKQASRQAGRQASRQASRQAGRQASRQAGRNLVDDIHEHHAIPEVVDANLVQHVDVNLVGFRV
jgi:hypothetical protein